MYAPVAATGQHALDDLGQPPTARFGKSTDWLLREISHRWEPPVDQAAIPLLVLIGLGTLARVLGQRVPTARPRAQLSTEASGERASGELASPAEHTGLPARAWSVAVGVAAGLVVVGLYSFYPEPETLRRDLMEARADTLLALTQKKPDAYRDAAEHCSAIAADMRVSAVLWLSPLTEPQSAALSSLTQELAAVAETLDEADPASFARANVRLIHAFQEVKNVFPAGGPR